MDIGEVVPLETIATLAPEDALQAIAQLVDYALDRGDLALTTKALELCDEVESRLTSDRQRIHLDYFRANA